MSIPPRTNIPAVEALLGGTTENSNWDGITDVSPYISAASNLTDQVVKFASTKAGVSGGYTIDATTAEIIERWLAAHFYQSMDPAYTSKSTAGASGSFMGQADKGLDSTRYGQQAQVLDWTGTLRALNKRAFVGMYWPGRDLSLCGTGNPNPDGLFV